MFVMCTCRNYDEILKVADAIMVSRINLGMVIKPEKVCWGTEHCRHTPCIIH